MFKKNSIEIYRNSRKTEHFIVIFLSFQKEITGNIFFRIFTAISYILSLALSRKLEIRIS